VEEPAEVVAVVPSSAGMEPLRRGLRSGDTDGERTRTEVLPKDRWSPGAVIAGKYEILARVGEGGFGTVYKVRHIFRKKYYALKTPHPEFARDEVFRKRFEREIEAMERFVHQDAVMIRDSGVAEEGRPYYTMDFIEGESLKMILQREGRFSSSRALHIITRVLKVLDVAHAHHVIHRDMKPDNILLTHVSGRERVKVLDFGVAKLLDLVGDTGSLTRGDRIGTPKYMSPEQITGEDVDARSDIFSLGIVFYEMVTGQHPFAKVRDPIRVTGAILNREPEPPCDIVPDLPRAINDHILCMIDKKAKRRPPSASALREQLEVLQESLSHLEFVETLEVYPGVARKRAEPLILRQDTSAGERRCFMLFDERVSLGRSNDPDKGIRNQILLRCLPCRSRQRDPENWRRNLTISHAVGTLFPCGSALVIEPAPGSKHGIVIGGVKSNRTARIQTDRFHLSVGDRALELDGYRVLRNAEAPELDLSFLEEGRAPGIDPPRSTGYSNGACRIDCAYFFRANNTPLHEYYMVYRILKIGSSANSGLRLRGAGVAGTHAAILVEGGEVFLLALAAGVRVLGLESAEGGEDLGEVEVPLRKLVPLGSGIELVLGDAHLTVDAATETEFKSC
jgi:serine/threonine protein kinase